MTNQPQTNGAPFYIAIVLNEEEGIGKIGKKKKLVPPTISDHRKYHTVPKISFTTYQLSLRKLEYHVHFGRHMVDIIEDRVQSCNIFTPKKCWVYLLAKKTQ